MSTQRESNRAGPILLAVGIPCLLLSLIVFSQRQDLATFLMGARFLFGMPLASTDALKLYFVCMASVIGLLMSLTLIVSGIVVFLRSPRVQSGPEDASAMPTLR